MDYSAAELALLITTGTAGVVAIIAAIRMKRNGNSK